MLSYYGGTTDLSVSRTALTNCVYKLAMPMIIVCSFCKLFYKIDPCVPKDFIDLFVVSCRLTGS